MELGVPTEARKSVYQYSKLIGCKEADDYVYFPKANEVLQCQVKYRALLESGYLRLPSFVKFTS